MSAQCGESAASSSEAFRKGEVSTNRGPFLYFMMLMGRTVGLSQRAGARTGDGLVAGGRGVGKLLKTPSKLWPSGERKAKKRRTRALRPAVEPPQNCTREIYARIGDNI